MIRTDKALLTAVIVSIKSCSEYPAVKTRSDDEHSKLANLLANREDGIDTFGNWGNLRCVYAVVILQQECV